MCSTDRAEGLYPSSWCTRDRVGKLRWYGEHAMIMLLPIFLLAYGPVYYQHRAIPQIGTGTRAQRAVINHLRQNLSIQPVATGAKPANVERSWAASGLVFQPPQMDGRALSAGILISTAISPARAQLLPRHRHDRYAAMPGFLNGSVNRTQ